MNILNRGRLWWIEDDANQFEIKDGVAIILEGITVIGWGAFQDCTSLKSITIPKSITEIHAYAFNECSALSTIYVPAMKADYYKKRLPEKLHDKIVEIEPEKKTKVKSHRNN